MDLNTGITGTSIFKIHHSSNSTQERPDLFKNFYSMLAFFQESLEPDDTEAGENTNEAPGASGTDQDLGYFQRTDGGAGDDVIIVGRDKHVTYGRAGNDVIKAGRGSHTIYGGAGNDFIETFGGTQTVYAGDGDDVVRATTGGTVHGGAGNDVIKTSAGRCELYGGDGNDVILASGMNAGGLVKTVEKGMIHGGAGDDVIEVIGGSKEIYGGTGDDFIKAKWGEATIRGGVGNDVIDLVDSSAEIHFKAGDGSDTISGAGRFDSLIFSGGLSRENASFELKDGNLTISFEGSDDQVALKDWDIDTSPDISFSDGTSINGSEIKNLLP